MRHQVSRPAGIGIFIVNNNQQPPSTIYIRASMPSTTSVLMAEAAGLALAATMATTLHIRDPTFLSDNQQLVNFINANDHSSPPLWSIKNYTQTFFNHFSAESCKVFKIDRSFNSTAHLLARQAFATTPISTQMSSYSCTNLNHDYRCPYREALNSISLEGLTLLAVSCC